MSIIQYYIINFSFNIGGYGSKITHYSRSLNTMLWLVIHVNVYLCLTSVVPSDTPSNREIKIINNRKSA